MVTEDSSAAYMSGYRHTQLHSYDHSNKRTFSKAYHLGSEVRDITHRWPSCGLHYRGPVLTVAVHHTVVIIRSIIQFHEIILECCSFHAAHRAVNQIQNLNEWSIWIKTAQCNSAWPGWQCYWYLAHRGDNSWCSVWRRRDTWCHSTDDETKPNHSHHIHVVLYYKHHLLQQ